jgi:hypothetical protein
MKYILLFALCLITSPVAASDSDAASLTSTSTLCDSSEDEISGSKEELQAHYITKTTGVTKGSQE